MPTRLQKEAEVSVMVTVVEVNELDALLEEAARRGFYWYRFREDHNGPDVFAGMYPWRDCADVYVLSDVEHAHAYRVPTNATPDVFAPNDLLWWYGSDPVWTLRMLLTLASPDDPNAPIALAPAPANSGVRGNRIPVRVRRRGC